MERAFPTASLYVSFRLTSLYQGRVSRDCYEGVQLWVELLYAAQTRLRQIDR
jgi:hypothetical protein